MITEWLSRAWEAYKNNAGSILAFLVVLGLIAGAVLVAAFLLLLVGLVAWPLFLVAVLLAVWVMAFGSAASLAFLRDVLAGKAEMGKALAEGLGKSFSMLGVLLVKFLIFLVPTILVALFVVGPAVARGIEVAIMEGRPDLLGVRILGALASPVNVVAILVVAAVTLYVYLRLIWAEAYVVTKSVGILALAESWKETEKDLRRAAAFFLLAVGFNVVYQVLSWVLRVIPGGGLIATGIFALLLNPIMSLAYIQAAEGK